MDVKDVTPMGDEGSLAYTTHILTAVPGMELHDLRF